jgi:membrane fusion protein, adhesin transport system
MLNISKKNIDKQIETSELYSMSMMHSHRFSKTVSYVLIGIFIFVMFVMFLPWQQNIFSVNGSVTALYPEDRPQKIESTIAGKIAKWHIHEGQHIKKGDPIITLTEVKEKFLDPQLSIRLQEQYFAKENVLKSSQDKIGAINNQIIALENANRLSLDKAHNKLKQAILKTQSDSADYTAEKNNFSIAQNQFDRSVSMYEKGLIPLYEFEKRKAKLQESKAKLVSYENKVAVSKNEIINAKIELNSISADYMDKISKANSEKSSAQVYFSNSEGEISKLKNEIANVDIRNQQYIIYAPQNGYIVKAISSGLGEIIKEDEEVVTIMPENPKIAAELYVYPMDVPLLSLGRKVRLEFDGWPSLQFSGWPNVAVGTFGGKIEVIDRVQSENGKFRLLVIPDEHSEPWPKQLRMGSGVKGWALLDEVKVGYEIWRQLNGFPPSLKEKPIDKEYSKTKK